MANEFNVPPVIFSSSGATTAAVAPPHPSLLPPHSSPLASLPPPSSPSCPSTSASPPPPRPSPPPHSPPPPCPAPTTNEPPLLEELGINTRQIWLKTTFILNPVRVNPSFHEDLDLSGPFLFLLAFGLFQLLSGKFHFGIILGWFTIASLFLYIVFNMLSGRKGLLFLFVVVFVMGIFELVWSLFDHRLGRLLNAMGQDNGNPSWKLSLPHVSVATIVSFLFGYHVGVVNEPLESISLDLGFGGNTLAEGLVVSMCLGGAFLGCLFSGWVADGIGRRRAFQLSALPMVIGASVSATATSLELMLLGRFLVGTGMGLGPPVAALYVTEVSPPSVRGTYGSFIQIATCLGIIGALIIGIPVKEVVGWWRVCFWASVVPAALLALCMEFCAESPHWLYKRGRIAEAESEFERLLGGSHVTSAMSELSRLDRGDDMESITFSDLIYGRHFRVVFIGTTLFALQQLSGINAVFYFSSTVFRSAGVPSDFANICIGIANLSGSVIAMILMDKLGRKLLLLGSFIGMALAMCLQVVAASFPPLGSRALYLSVGGMLLFVFTFAVGAGPVPSLLLPEIFPNKIRAKAMALCMSVHWVVNFFVGLLFLRLMELLGAQILYTIFGSFCLIAAVFVRKNVVETKGKSLQEIEISLLPAE